MKLVRKVILLFFLLVFFSLSVSAFERTKIGNTFIVVDYKLNNTEIIDFVDNFDLGILTSVWFLNSKCYFYENGKWRETFGLYDPIFRRIKVCDMQNNIFWRVTFCHEYGHYDCLLNDNDLTEECAINYCDGDKD